MSSDLQRELEAVILSDKALEEIVALLREYKARGVTRNDVYSFLEVMRQGARDETEEDRILEVADFVTGFCSPHMKVWDN